MLVVRTCIPSPMAGATFCARSHIAVEIMARKAKYIIMFGCWTTAGNRDLNASRNSFVGIIVCADICSRDEECRCKMEI